MVVVVWLSVEAGHDARAASARLAGDLERLRRDLVDIDVDVLLRPTVETAVLPRREGSTFMVGRLRAEFEVETEPVAEAFLA